LFAQRQQIFKQHMEDGNLEAMHQASNAEQDIENNADIASKRHNKVISHHQPRY